MPTTINPVLMLEHMLCTGSQETKRNENMKKPKKKKQSFTSTACKARANWPTKTPDHNTILVTSKTGVSDSG
jgi:hypothetical protein